MFRMQQRMNTIKYAALEITLIVLGVLTAIQANNWNETRKYKNEQLKFLHSLKSELNADLTLIENKRDSFQRLNTLLTDAHTLLHKDEINQEEKNTISSAISIFPILTPINKNVERNNNLISTGIIENDHLNLMVLKYYETIKYTAEVQTKFGETLQVLYVNQISTLVKFNYLLGKSIEFSLKEIQSSPLFINALDLSFGYRKQALLFLKEQKEMAEKLMEFIYQEILYSL